MTPHPVEQLGAFLDGELGAAERERVERHLRACAECAQRLEDLAVLDAMAREAPVAAPEGYFDALPGRVRARLAFRPRRKAVVPAWSWAVAAALLLAVIAPRVLDRGPLPRSQEPGPAPVAQPAAPAPSEAPRALPDAMANPPSAGAPAQARSRALTPGAERLGPPAPAAALDSEPQDALAKAKKEAPSVAEAKGAEKDRQTAAFAEPPAPAEDSAKSLFRADSEPLREQVEAESPVAAPPPASAPARNESATTTTLGAAGRLAGAGARDEGRAKKNDARPPGPWYSALLARSAPDAAAARALREEWRAFAERHPEGARGDEARVRVIEAGLAAWRFSNDPADMGLLRQDAESYLRRDDAAQGQRVRALLNATGG